MTFIQIPDIIDTPIEIIDALGLSGLAAGNVIFGTSSTQLGVSSDLTWDNTNKTFLVKAKAAQTANIFTTQNSSSTELFSVKANGSLRIASMTTLAANATNANSLYYNSSLGRLAFQDPSQSTKYLTSGQGIDGQIAYFVGSYGITSSTGLDNYGGNGLRLTAKTFEVRNDAALDSYISIVPSYSANTINTKNEIDLNITGASNKGLVLKRTADSGTNNNLFEIQRSTDSSVSFQVLADGNASFQGTATLSFKDTSKIVFAQEHPTINFRDNSGNGNDLWIRQSQNAFYFENTTFPYSSRLLVALNTNSNETGGYLNFISNGQAEGLGRIEMMLSGEEGFYIYSFNFDDSQYARIDFSSFYVNLTSYDGITLQAPIVGVNTDTPTAPLDVNGNRVRIRTAQTISTASTTGEVGTICWDSSYIYVCIATNTWKRVAISTW